MTKYYGKVPDNQTVYGFFDNASECVNGVAVSDSDYATLMNTCTCQQRIVPDSNGYPVISNSGYSEDPEADTHILKSGDTMTGALVAQNNTGYMTKQVRNVFLSTAEPTASDGDNGDVWFVYE